MPDSFWSTLNGITLNRWFLPAIFPALTFWSGGIVVLVAHTGWSEVEKQYYRLSPLGLIGLAIIAASVLLLSMALIHIVQPFVFRALLGQWPTWVRPFSNALTNRVKTNRTRLNARFQVIQDQRRRGGLERLNWKERDELTDAVRTLRRIPLRDDNILPTHLGNVLAAANERPFNKYGLDVGVCWPRLWIVLPHDVQSDLNDARSLVEFSVRIWCWSILFVIWGAYIWWMGLIALVCTLIVYYAWLPKVIETYGDLMESTFDMYRLRLLEYLRWPLPKNPAEEHAIGEKITDYLSVGSEQTEPTFTEVPEVVPAVVNQRKDAEYELSTM
jgi:hypothetical protein